MIMSMTGYGRAETSNELRRLVCEIRSVNNRYLDFNIRMPRKFAFMENSIRNILKEYISRGKVDVFITYEDHGEGASSIVFNEAVAAEYVKHLKDFSEKYSVPLSLTAGELIRAQDVFTRGDDEPDEDMLKGELSPIIREAAAAYNGSRLAEGTKLRDDILVKLDQLKELADQVAGHESSVMEAYEQRLRERLDEFIRDHVVDESRIAAECVLYADRISTDEETVRLRSHIAQMRDVLMKEERCGKKLDFLAQEMNREANTTLSKAGDLITADLGIGMKTGIEKIREQIQNIE